ncbi:phage tail length tape measure family protein [Devosia lacusdianchii]|uniref:phage tail length tape measure family protein n=1 Tax=Devosia lacusdianchii TaxID=2917991 RepID=UPI001F068DEB|nr:phage tail length tape measure family protein [Devosia sp. JXJ CY 41]
MVDVARLGLAVDSSQVEKGTVTLHQLTGAAGQASAAAQRLAGATNVEAAGHRAAAAAAQVHNAALMAQNTVIRSSMQQRTMMIYQLNDVAVSLASGMNPAMVAMQQGSQILQGGFAPALKTISDLTVGLVTKFWPLAVVIGVVSAALQAMTDEINAVDGANVSMLDTALAVFQSMADGIRTLLGPAFDWLGGIWSWLSPMLLSGLEITVNAIIGGFHLGFKNIISIWSMLPAAMGDVMITTANVIVKGVEWSINKAAEFLNGFINKYNEGLAAMGQRTLPTFGGVEFGGLANPYAGSLGGFADAATRNQQEVAGTNYFGNWMSDIGQRAQAIAAARKETEELGGAAAAANDNFGKLVDQGLGGLVHWTESFGEAAKSAFSNLGTGIVDAFQKGGDIASNVLDMLMDKVGQFGETLLNNGLNGLLNAGLGALGGMFGGGTWGVAGGFSGFSGIFGIPGMASGGTVGRAGLSWVGEKGPELLRLPTGAQVIPNGPSTAMAANQNGGDLIINNVINVPGGTSPETAPAIAREVTKELRRQLPDAIERHNRNPLRRTG